MIGMFLSIEVVDLKTPDGMVDGDGERWLDAVTFEKHSDYPAGELQRLDSVVADTQLSYLSYNNCLSGRTDMELLRGVNQNS